MTETAIRGLPADIEQRRTRGLAGRDEVWDGVYGTTQINIGERLDYRVPDAA